MVTSVLFESGVGNFNELSSGKQILLYSIYFAFTSPCCYSSQSSQEAALHISFVFDTFIASTNEVRKLLCVLKQICFQVNLSELKEAILQYLKHALLVKEPERLAFEKAQNVESDLKAADQFLDNVTLSDQTRMQEAYSRDRCRLLADLAAAKRDSPAFDLYSRIVEMFHGI